MSFSNINRVKQKQVTCLLEFWQTAPLRKSKEVVYDHFISMNIIYCLFIIAIKTFTVIFN